MDTSYRSFDFFGYFYFLSFYDKDNFLSLDVLWHDNLLPLIITFYHQIAFSLDPSHISITKNQPN